MLCLSPENNFCKLNYTKLSVCHIIWLNRNVFNYNISEFMVQNDVNIRVASLFARAHLLHKVELSKDMISLTISFHVATPSFSCELVGYLACKRLIGYLMLMKLYCFSNSRIPICIIHYHYILPMGQEKKHLHCFLQV